MASGDSRQKTTKCERRNPYTLIRRLVELMEHPITTCDTKRHLELLQEFLNASNYAFWLYDIPYIIRLYDVIIKKLDTNPEYTKPLECLLYFSAVPPLMTKISDTSDYARDLQEYFTLLGYLVLCLKDDNLKKLALAAIKRLVTQKPKGYCCVNPEICREAIENSELPKILAHLGPLLHEELSPLLLEVIYLVCGKSKITCHKMMEEDILDCLILQFYPKWREPGYNTKPPNPSADDKHPLFGDLCCILWRLLNSIDNEQIHAPSVFCLWSLQYAFRWSNISPGNKINRNNLMALILKMMVTFPLTNFYKCGIFEDIATVAGAVAGCPCHSVLQFSDDEMDFQFKKIVWASLHHMLDMSVAEEKELMKAFLKFTFHEHPTTKNLEQYCTLSKILLKLIPKYIHCSLDYFIKLKGATHLVRQIEIYLSIPFDEELLEANMYCMSEILGSGNEEVVVIFGEQNTSHFVTALVRTILEVQTLARQLQKVLAYCFCILQILCAAGFVMSPEVVNLCLIFLNRVIQVNKKDPLIDVRTVICAIRLLWECIIAKTSFYKEFLKRGGMYVMLDITEASTFPVKSLSLGVLADTAKRPSCIPYLITWRKRGTGIIPMLMEIFRNKTEIDCHKPQKIELPEEESGNNKLTLCRRPVSFKIKCISHTELLKRNRYRIHGILYALKVEFRHKVQIANEHYRLFNAKLTTNDALTKLFAENFLSLILCHTWLSVAKELQQNRITLTDADSAHLVEKIQSIKQWKSYLQSRIRSIIEIETEQQYLDEFTTYTTLKEARLADALDALRELRYISNSTEKMFQLRKKLRLQQEVDSIHAKNPNFHRTICDLPVTNTYNQTISIQSNIIYHKKEEYSHVEPVSSDSSESLESLNSEHALTEPHVEC